MRYDFWYFIIDVWNEFDDNVKNMSINLEKRELNAIHAIDIIEKLIENVIKQMICVFVIKINKCDNNVDIDINLNIIDEIKNMSKKLNIIVTKTHVTSKLT